MWSFFFLCRKYVLQNSYLADNQAFTYITLFIKQGYEEKNAII